MRAYLTTTVSDARSIFRDGFTDMGDWATRMGLVPDGDCELHGVWLADRQLDCNEGFDGEVTLCLEMPEDVFKRHEMVEDGGGPGYRLALIPADALNKLGRS